MIVACCECPSDFLRDYAVPLGIGFSLVLGSVFITLLFNWLGRHIDRQKVNSDASKQSISEQGENLIGWLQCGVGVTERTIYYAAVYFNQLGFLAGWFALKAVLKFSDKESFPHGPAYMQAKYHHYLLGSGISLLFGAGGALLTLYWQGKPILPLK